MLYTDVDQIRAQIKIQNFLKIIFENRIGIFEIIPIFVWTTASCKNPWIQYLTSLVLVFDPLKIRELLMF